jgi:hypothetical protein
MIEKETKLQLGKESRDGRKRGKAIQAFPL